MPKRNIVQIQLPSVQPDCCADCPLCGLVPKPLLRPKSQESHVCCGTMEALGKRFIRVRASSRDAKHPLHRPCDTRWAAWLTLPQRRLGIPADVFVQCRVPYEQAQQLTIHFHR